jgi:tetratricopeptide (TPR) repeat protein
MFVSLSLSSPAGAQEPAKPDYAEAKKRFKAGQEFLQMDRYADAVAEFRKAYEITRDGLVMGQVAQAYAKAGDYEAALAAIKIYREALPEGERTETNALIVDYEKYVKEGKSKKLILPAEKTAESQPTEDATRPPPPEVKKRGRFYTWIAAGATGALAVSALIVGLSAQSKYDELQDKCKPSCSESDVDSVKTRAVTSDVLWGMAAAAAVTTGVLYFLEGRSASKEKPETPGEGEEESVSHRLRVSPVVGVGSYGLRAGFTF